jgi:hypothetical protein
MAGLDYEVWNDRVHNFPRILVSHRRTGAPEDAVTRTVRAPAAMWIFFARVQCLCVGQMVASSEWMLVSLYFNDSCRSELG